MRSPRFEELDRELTQLLETIHANPTSNSLSLSLHSLAILSRLTGATRENLDRLPQPAIVKDPLVETALQFIWTSHHRTISVAAVAQHVGVNRRTLERRFFSETNRSVLDQIIQCRFNRAERLLRETKLSVKAIISLLGFGLEETMRKTFLKRTNQSPSACPDWPLS